MVDDDTVATNVRKTKVLFLKKNHHSGSSTPWPLSHVHTTSLQFSERLSKSIGKSRGGIRNVAPVVTPVQDPWGCRSRIHSAHHIVPDRSWTTCSYMTCIQSASTRLPLTFRFAELSSLRHPRQWLNSFRQIHFLVETFYWIDWTCYSNEYVSLVLKLRHLPAESLKNA